MVTVKKQIADALDEHELAVLYGEFAEEDRELSESGLADYVDGLASEDGKSPFPVARQSSTDVG